MVGTRSFTFGAPFGRSFRLVLLHLLERDRGADGPGSLPDRRLAVDDDRVRADGRVRLNSCALPQ
jgi:hypothetical protein